MESGYVTVVGAVNVDIVGKSQKPLLMGDSNPGSVSVSLGGVGRNIADNLRRLGASVRMVTALGGDVYAQKVREECAKQSIDLSLSLTAEGENTSVYLCIHDSDGTMRLAVSDMDICRHISPDFLMERMGEINRSRLVVMDANLQQEAAACLADHCTVPLFADPVSVAKAARLKSCLHGITCIKPNVREAEVLTGIAIRNDGDLQRAASTLHEMGVKTVFISLGARGAYFDGGGDRGILPCYPGEIVNTTGCGDAFLAAAAYGHLMGRKIDEMAQMGLAAASLCAASEGAVREDLTLALVERKMLGGGKI